MKVAFKSSFARDLKNAKDKDLRAQIGPLIELVEKAGSLLEVKDATILKGGDHYYRIRIGNFRVGLTLEGDTVTFVRLLQRKDIYRYFP